MNTVKTVCVRLCICWLGLLGISSGLLGGVPKEACVCSVKWTSFYQLSTHDKLKPDAASVLVPWAAVITPNSKQLWIVSLGYLTPLTEVSIFDLVKGEITKTVPLAISFFAGEAVTPNGKEVWVCGRGVGVPPGVVFVIDAQKAEIKNTFFSDVNFSNIAITPDGTESWVGDNVGNIWVYDATTPTFKTTFVASSSAKPIRDMAMTPDNKKAFVCEENGSVVVIDRTTHSIITSLPTITNPAFIATSPNNTYVSVVDTLGNVYIVDTTTYNIEGVVSLGQEPGGLAIDPDSKEVWVVAGNTSIVTINPKTVSITDTVPVTVPLVFSHSLPTIFGPASPPLCLSITPAEAPTAKFTTHVEGLSVDVDAAASHSHGGPIVKYNWNFGDGSGPRVTSKPKVSHTYKKQGEYLITLTVTDASGTSAKPIYTGKMVTNNGGPSAQHSSLVNTSAQSHKFHSSKQRPIR